MSNSSMLILLAFILYCIHNPTCWKAQSAGVPFLSVVDYYWRDYHGYVPKDAVPGGTCNSTNTFIGQFSIYSTYRNNNSNVDTLPAVIYRGQRTAETTYRGSTIYSTASSIIKVLCSRHLPSYRWIPTTSQLVPGCQAVFGGIEDEIILYIGRALQNGEKVIGKVFSDTTYHTSRLITPQKGKENLHDKYDILIYCDGTVEEFNNPEIFIDVRSQD